MKIADLFIAISMTGTQKVGADLKDTRKGLNEAASSALWAKAAIIGMLYGLERLVSTSNRAGSELQQFSAFTGLSAEKLQRYAYAGRQFGASAEEIKGSIMGVQKAMAQLETTGQGPSGLWVVAREVGLDRNKIRDTTYLFEQLQKFAQTTKLPTGIANQALESFGLSAGTIAAMRKNAFNPEAMAKASIYTDRETERLQKMNAAWGNLSDRIEKAIGHLNVKYGGGLIRDIGNIADKVLVLTDRLILLADKAQVFKAIAKSFEGWAILLDGINGKLDEVTKKGGTPEMEKKGFLTRLLFDTTALARDAGQGKDVGFQEFKADMRNWSYMIDEKLGAAKDGERVMVQQQQNFYGQTEPRAAGAAARAGAEKGVSDATRQSQALRRKH